MFTRDQADEAQLGQGLPIRKMRAGDETAAEENGQQRKICPLNEPLPAFLLVPDAMGRQVHLVQNSAHEATDRNPGNFVVAAGYKMEDSRVVNGAPAFMASPSAPAGENAAASDVFLESDGRKSLRNQHRATKYRGLWDVV